MGESRVEVCERANKLDLSMELFPPKEPWRLFPWEAQFRPRSELEDKLRQASGLRDLEQLRSLLVDAKSQGLNRRNSRLFFEAAELQGQLEAEVAVTAKAATQARAVSAGSTAALTDSEAATEASDLTAETADSASAAEGAPAMTAQLDRAISVFLEPVSTVVLDHVPLQRPFV